MNITKDTPGLCVPAKLISGFSFTLTSTVRHATRCADAGESISKFHVVFYEYGFSERCVSIVRKQINHDFFL
jgi:hypothetical protein